MKICFTKPGVPTSYVVLCIHAKIYNINNIIHADAFSGHHSLPHLQTRLWHCLTHSSSHLHTRPPPTETSTHQSHEPCRAHHYWSEQALGWGWWGSSGGWEGCVCVRWDGLGRVHTLTRGQSIPEITPLIFTKAKLLLACWPLSLLCWAVLWQ